MVRIGLLGTGVMGMTHTQCYQALPDAEVAGSFAVPKEALDKFCTGFGCPPYASFDDMLADQTIDVIDVCTPNFLHVEQCVRALDAGKHVLCEKPVALTTDGVREIVSHIRPGQIFMVAQVIRFWPEYQYLKRIVDEGTMGKITSGLFIRNAGGGKRDPSSWYADPAKVGSPALDLHIHDIDFIRSILGTPTGWHSTGTYRDGVLDHLLVNYSFASGASVIAEAGSDLPGHYPFQMFYRVVFEDGVVEFDGRLSPALMVYRFDKPVETPEFAIPDLGEIKSGVNVGAISGYYNELKYFVECVRDNRMPEVITPQDSVESLDTALKVIADVAKA